VPDETKNVEIPKIAGVLLAAGASRRLGEPKQLVMYNSSPLVRHAASLALQVCDAGLIVVTGAHHDAIVAALEGLPVQAVYSADWPEGIGASIRQGIASVHRDVGAILLTVCDQPFVSTEDIRNLFTAWKRNPDRIAAAGYSGTRGVPAIFPAHLRQKLLHLQGDRGAKNIIDTAAEITVVPMPNGSFDIDTPDQLHRLRG
jgi:molybdenum cofactor cytidylyltransferase